MKKTLSILLSFVMLLSITSGLSFSAYAETSGDYEYELLEDGTAAITKYNGNGGDVSIPSIFGDYTVTSIGVSAFEQTGITRITIPSSIANIGECSFINCPNLKNITVDAENNNYISVNGVLYNKNKTDLIQYPVADTASSFVIPNTVKEIGFGAFLGCKSLKSVIIPNSVTIIGQGAFSNCTGLTSVTIPGSVENMGEGAFAGNTSLTSVVISEGVRNLGSRTFIYCSNLKSITIPKSFKSLLWEFNGCNLTDVYYKGTTLEWNRLISNWHDDDQQSFAKAAIYCTDGVINCKHNCKTKTTKATTSKNGSVVTKCSVCGDVKSKSTIYYPKSIMLSATSYTYDGKTKKPSVTVKDSNGKKIASSNYTVTYANGRKNVGTYTVTIKFKGNNYSGTVKKTFTIKPKATSISKLTSGKKKFTVTWKKQTTQTTGYQIQYSTDKNFKKNNKTVTIAKNKTTSKKISNLKPKKKYYVRVRTYKTVKVNGKSTKIYSSWSKAKTVTTK